ncbi:hypothetical protein [Streptomyces globisporus]|uniref:hypothetical protein n=1 Tax=Streptomyces globisporus TaxID=1908 RepID=UPI003821090C
MYRPHHSDRRPPAERVTTPAAETGPAAVQAAEDDFESAVFSVADRPVGLAPSGSIDISLDELSLCEADPLGLVVLIRWRFLMKAGLPCTAEGLWASLTESGKTGADGESPVRLDDVTRALEFLDRNGALGVSR